MMDKSKLKVLFALHLMLMIYSMSGICSKMASQQDFLSFKFCLFYAIIIFLLGFYAIGWQQIIKRLPLTTAFANKAVTVVWGIIWGAVFFHECFYFLFAPVFYDDLVLSAGNAFYSAFEY